MSSQIHLCQTSSEVAPLVAHIKETVRLPIVVVSLAEGESSPTWDIEQLADRLSGEAVLYLIDHEAGFSLTEQMGGKANSVHSGWIRIYPAAGWSTGDQNRNRIAPNHSRPELVFRKIIDRVDLAAWSNFVPKQQQSSSLVVDSVRIENDPSEDPSQLLPGRSQLDPNRHCIIRHSSLYPGIPAHRLLRKGMVLSGKRTNTFLPEFYPEKPNDDLETRLKSFIGEIVCTWALVREVKPDHVTLLLHPEVPLEIYSDSIDLNEEYSADEVVKVYVLPTESGYEVTPASELDDAQDSISAFPGGPPWLMPKSLVVEELDLMVDEAFADEELILAHKSIERLQREILELKDKLRSSRAKLIVKLHPDDETCLRAAIVANYYKRLTATDRAEYPLQELVFEKEFFLGFAEACGMVPYETVLRAVVNIASGHPQTRTEKFKSGSRFSDEVDGWQTRRGHIADETSGAPRIRFSKRGNVTRFEHAGHHDDDL